MLQLRDVYVSDHFGLEENGASVGDNVGSAIYAKTGNGIVYDGAVRDINGLREMENFTAFVMPGDVVLGRDGGVIFIPPQLAEQVVRTSEITRLRDEFGHARLRAKVYTAGQIDGRWSEAIEADFTQWLRENIDKLPVARAQIEELLKRR